MSRAIISCSVERFEPWSFIRDRVFEFKKGLMTESAASTNQGWPMKWMPLKRTGKESCEVEIDLSFKYLKFQTVKEVKGEGKNLNVETVHKWRLHGKGGLGVNAVSKASTKILCLSRRHLWKIPIMMNFTHKLIFPHSNPFNQGLVSVLVSGIAGFFGYRWPVSGTRYPKLEVSDIGIGYPIPRKRPDT